MLIQETSLTVTYKKIEGIKKVYYNNDNILKKFFNEATALFGIMRDATLEEQANVNKYIKSISKNTGVNFFDLC